MVSLRDIYNMLWFFRNRGGGVKSPEVASTIANSSERYINNLKDINDWLEKDPNRKLSSDEANLKI